MLSGVEVPSEHRAAAFLHTSMSCASARHAPCFASRALAISAASASRRSSEPPSASSTLSRTAQIVLCALMVSETTCACQEHLKADCAVTELCEEPFEVWQVKGKTTPSPCSRRCGRPHECEGSHPLRACGCWPASLGCCVPLLTVQIDRCALAM